MAVRCSTQRGAGLAAGKRGALLGALLMVLATAGMAAAQTVVIDSTTSGSTYDAILDGFPGLAALDGTPDFAGNALAVGFKAGVTKENGIAELPLAPLAGATASEIANATLTFNIDDILSTFGPGTDFDGTGSDPISIAIYSGDGTVALDDFNRGTHVATVATGGASITDATLAQSGPLEFDVDVTEALKSLVAGNATFIGIVFSTTDTPTGTSLDDLGTTGGPPGVGGARFPYLTVEIEEAAPTPSPAPSPSPSPAPSAAPSPSPQPSVTPTPIGPTPTPTAPPALTPSPAPSTGPTPGPSTEPTPVTTPTAPVEPTSSPATTPTPAGSSTPTPASSSSPGTTPTPGPTSTAGATPTPPGATATPGGTPTPTRSPRPTPTPRSSVVPPESIAPGPAYSGDQLIFYYDARASFTTFLNIRNQGDDDLSVEIVFLGPDLTAPVEELITLPARGTRTVDVGLLAASGLPARFGIALAFAVDGAGAPVVSRALEGGFTIANLMIGSAWGAPAPARRAIRSQGGSIVEPSIGASIDGTTVALEDVRPDRLSIATYYDPETLEPATFSGNQLILISFDDLPGAGVTPEETTWEIDVQRNDGASLDVDPLTVAGVVVTDLVAVAGDAVNGAAGSMRFSASANGAENRLIFFTESVGTYSAGYLLPHPAPAATPGSGASVQ